MGPPLDVAWLHNQSSVPHNHFPAHGVELNQLKKQLKNQLGISIPFKTKKKIFLILQLKVNLLGYYHNCNFILLKSCSSTILCIFHDISQWVTITFYSLPKKVLKPFPQFSTSCLYPVRMLCLFLLKIVLFSSHVCRIQIITSALGDS